MKNKLSKKILSSAILLGLSVGMTSCSAPQAGDDGSKLEVNEITNEAPAVEAEANCGEEKEAEAACGEEKEPEAACGEAGEAKDTEANCGEEKAAETDV